MINMRSVVKNYSKVCSPVLTNALRHECGMSQVISGVLFGKIQVIRISVHSTILKCEGTCCREGKIGAEPDVRA